MRRHTSFVLYIVYGFMPQTEQENGVKFCAERDIDFNVMYLRTNQSSPLRHKRDDTHILFMYSLVLCHKIWCAILFYGVLFKITSSL